MTTADVMSGAVEAGRSPEAGQCMHMLGYQVSLSWYLQGSKR